jgi:sugar lactone lactonase YvrE
MSHAGGAVTVLPSPRCLLGEGPVWHDEALWWVDIEGRALHRHAPGSGAISGEASPVATFADTLGCVVPRRSGGWVAGVGSALAWLTPEGRVTRTLTLPGTTAATRCNDGKTDPSGRLWIGTMARDASDGGGGLYRVDTDGSIHQILEGCGIANGLGWSRDRTRFYFADSLRHNVRVFPFDDRTGSLGEGRVLAEIPASAGFADGLTLDRDDHVWLALWGGSSLIQLDGRTGATLSTVALPAPHVTSCAFGGTDYSTLFITTARTALSAAEQTAHPDAGRVFSLTQPGLSGFAPFSTFL